jgi:hypothetical protein
MTNLLLQRERDQLRAQRVSARRAIESARWTSDPIDRMRLIETARMVLRGTETRWQELQILLRPRDMTLSSRPQPPQRSKPMQRQPLQHRSDPPLSEITRNWTTAQWQQFEHYKAKFAHYKPKRSYRTRALQTG